MRRFLFFVPSGYGYLFPSIKLAHLLQARGHAVFFVVADVYSTLLTLNGIPHLGVANTASALPFLHPGCWFEPVQNREQVRVFEASMREFCPDVIVTSALTLSGMIVAERHGLPVVLLGFVEYLYPGVGDPGSRKQWRLRDITAHYNVVRAELDLPPVLEDAERTPLLGQLYLFPGVPDLLDGVQLPERVLPVGSGLYWEPPTVNHPLARFVAEGRAAGRPLVYVQIGRLFEAGHKWATLLDGLAQLPAIAVADVGRQDYLEGARPAPDNVFVAPFVSLGAVAGEACCVLSSCQSASVLAAIVHGLPVLCLPHSDDARETAERFVRQGLGLELSARIETAAQSLGALLDRLREEGGFRARLAAVRDEFARYGESQRIVERIEVLGS